MFCLRGTTAYGPHVVAADLRREGRVRERRKEEQNCAAACSHAPCACRPPVRSAGQVSATCPSVCVRVKTKAHLSQRLGPRARLLLFHSFVLPPALLSTHSPLKAIQRDTTNVHSANELVYWILDCLIVIVARAHSHLDKLLALLE